MTLTAPARHLDQIVVGQDHRAPQDRLGHLQLVVGQTPDQAVRRIGGGGETGGQLGAHCLLHLVGQFGQHRAIQGGLAGAVLGGAEEMAGQFAQQQPALVAGLLAGQRDQLGQARRGDDGGLDRGRVAHGRSSACVWGTARSEPLALRIRAGGPSGWARSSDLGVWVICTGRASK